MSNLIGFLENAGRNAMLRYASREQLLRAMQQQNIESASRDALLQSQGSALEAILGARETMYCINEKIEPAKKKRKAPTKKTPAKKAPAKKGPAKRK